jgi:hypothetical protein
MAPRRARSSTEALASAVRKKRKFPKRKVRAARTVAQARTEPVEGIALEQRSRRGRPPRTEKRRPVMVYLTTPNHHNLSMGAKIAGRSVSDIVEMLVEAWIHQNAAAIQAAKEALDPRKLINKIELS